MKQSIRLKRGFYLGMVAILALVSWSCSQQPALAEAFGKMEAMSAELNVAPAAVSRVAEDSVMSGSSSEPVSPGSPAPQERERKQVKTATLGLEVSNLAETEKAISDKVAALGGFVEMSQAGEGWMTMVLRLPSESLDGVFKDLSNQGRVKEKTVQVSDVTTQYYDLEARVTNQKVLLEQYREFMDRAETMEEILDVMRRITELTTDIENLEGQFRYLARQVSFSTLTVNLSLPVLSGGRPWPNFGEGLENLGYNIVGFLQGVLFFILGLLIYGPIVLGLAYLVVWLGFGKPGLVRRLGKIIMGTRGGTTTPTDQGK